MASNSYSPVPQPSLPSVSTPQLCVVITKRRSVTDNTAVGRRRAPDGRLVTQRPGGASVKPAPPQAEEACGGTRKGRSNDQAAGCGALGGGERDDGRRSRQPRRRRPGERALLRPLQ